MLSNSGVALPSDAGRGDLLCSFSSLATSVVSMGVVGTTGGGGGSMGGGGKIVGGTNVGVVTFSMHKKYNSNKNISSHLFGPLAYLCTKLKEHCFLRLLYWLKINCVFFDV